MPEQIPIRKFLWFYIKKATAFCRDISPEISGNDLKRKMQADQRIRLKSICGMAYHL